MKFFKIMFMCIGVAIFFVGLTITMNKKGGKFCAEGFFYLERIEKQYRELKEECAWLKKECNRLLKKQEGTSLQEWEEDLKRREKDLEKREENWKKLLKGDVFEMYKRLARDFWGDRKEHVRWHRQAIGRCNAAKSKLKKLKTKTTKKKKKSSRK